MKLLRAWNTFWFAPISARPLGAFRIAYGLVALMNLALLALEIDYWFTDHGLLVGAEARHAAGPLRFSLLHYVQDPVSVRIYFAAVAAVMVLFTLGWHTRVMSILLYLGMMSIHHRNISSANGADVLVMIVSFYMMLSPCGAAFSLDARRAARRRGAAAEPLIVPWAQRLLQVHFSMLYLNTALLKAAGSSWQNGSALHYVLNNVEVRRFDFSWLSQYSVLINLMTYGALMVEFALAFLLWFKAARPWVMLAGVGLHTSIMVFVNIPVFGELMMACYLLFLTPEELGTLRSWVDPRCWLGRSRAAAQPRIAAVPRPVALVRGPSVPAPGPHWGSEPTPAGATGDDAEVEAEVAGV